MSMAASSLFEKLSLHAPHLSTKRVIPAFIYGTAWKKEATAGLVYQALCSGFTAIDTAAQPKHYREELVASGVSKAIKEGKIKRSDLYLQTKFTSIDGQDPNDLPYDPKSSIQEQVNASVMSSLRNFSFTDVAHEDDPAAQDDYIDTLVLHSPMPTINETLEVWTAMEQYVPGDIRHLGISNCNLFMLMDLYERANTKPSVVQNRFYSNSKFDIGVRQFCREKGIIYQSFWTLTGNPSLVKSVEVKKLAQELDTSLASAFYCFVLGLENVTILNGTTNQHHMKQDWDVLLRAKTLAESNPSAWEARMGRFRQLIGQPTY